MIRALLLEDDGNDSALVIRKLRGVATVQVATDEAQFRALLAQHTFDIVMVDFSVPGFSGPEAIALVRQLRPETPVVIITGSVTHTTARAACRLGAVDFVIKGDEDAEYERLDLAVTNAVEAHKARMMQLRDHRMEMLGSLSTGACHDLRNILGTVQLACGILRDRVGDDDRLILDRMEDAVKRGEKLMAEILAFARGTNGQAFKSTSVEFLLGEIGRELRSGAFPNIQHTVRWSPGTNNVNCDANQLHQVLLNCLLNARDAMPDGGQIDVTAQNVRLTEGDFVRIDVRDTGTGIPAQHLPNIFDAFWTSKAKGQGTGMGLAIVKRIVESHHGTVTVETGAAGTTFTVCLPALVEARSTP
jgi:signal transduction histidine kinase